MSSEAPYIFSLAPLDPAATYGGSRNTPTGPTFPINASVTENSHDLDRTITLLYLFPISAIQPGIPPYGITDLVTIKPARNGDRNGVPAPAVSSVVKCEIHGLSPHPPSSRLGIEEIGIIPDDLGIAPGPISQPIEPSDLVVLDDRPLSPPGDIIGIASTGTEEICDIGIVSHTISFSEGSLERVTELPPQERLYPRMDPSDPSR